MADDIQSSLAPWMTSNMADPSTYGGLGQLGMSLLANSGPTPYRVPFGAAIAKGAMAAQQQAQQNAMARMGLEQQALQMGLTRERLQAIQDYANGGQSGATPPGSPGIPPGFPQGMPAQGLPTTPVAMPSGMPSQGASSQPQTSFDVPQADIYSTPISGHSADQFKRLQLAFGKDPGEAETVTRKIQLENAQAAIKPRIELLDQVAKSDKAAQMASASPPLMQLWNKSAPQYGFNPTSDYNDANVRRVFSARRNELAAWAQLPTEAPPNQLVDVAGPYGYRGQKDVVSGKETQVQGREMPTFTTKPVWNPATNTNREVPIQTGGWGMGGINPVSGRTVGGVNAPTVAPGAGRQSTAGPVGVDTGYKPPDDTNLKSAMFASEMRAGLQKIRELESQGFTLKPSERALFINIAASHDSNVVTQLIGQEVLARKLSPEAQQYMSALMPMLQAVGHDQSGARLSEYQIRQNLESVVPINAKDPAGLAQVNKNREGFYTGVLTQAGSAVQLPQYRDTLASDLTKAQQPKALPTGARLQLYAQTHFKGDIGKAQAFLKSQGYQ